MANAGVEYMVTQVRILSRPLNFMRERSRQRGQKLSPILSPLIKE
jgi:hypothetical protein